MQKIANCLKAAYPQMTSPVDSPHDVIVEAAKMLKIDDEIVENVGFFKLGRLVASKFYGELPSTNQKAGEPRRFREFETPLAAVRALEEAGCDTSDPSDRVPATV